MGPSKRIHQVTKEIAVGQLFDGTDLHLVYHVYSGRKEGPTAFVSAAVHGDEICGIEMIRRFTQRLLSTDLIGQVITVPIVNVFGFNSQSRYLPDRRDLNRSFPGRPQGSLASQLAHLFLAEIVQKADFGIDIHSASLNKNNLPHIRGDLSDPLARKIAECFGAPVIMDSPVRSGSLRESAAQKGVPVVVLEAGEALRFNESFIRLGVEGLLSVLTSQAMIERPMKRPPKKEVYEAKSSFWLRAETSGIVQKRPKLGTHVKKGQKLATIGDRFGRTSHTVVSPHEGVVIGELTLPLVTQGDAMFHVATFEDPSLAAEVASEWVDFETTVSQGT